jgi:glucuronate isomerase
MNATKNIEGNGKLKSTFFLYEDFLLHSDAAKNLYHNYAADLPIIDYHNHLPVNEIAENKKFANLTEIWLQGDHYKWRAMRTLGVNEKFITGDANDLEKFTAWAACVPQTVRNPLFHWTHMELKNPFGINEYLDTGNGNKIYTTCNELLAGDSFSTRGLLQHFNVEMACTTDDPCDTLMHHKKIAGDAFKIQVLPGFRPDKILNIADRENFKAYVTRLEAASGITISDFNSLVAALQQRVEYFHESGCRISDHGLTAMPSFTELTTEEINECKWFLISKERAPFSQPEKFAGVVLKELCKMYHAKGWVQQFHLGPIRNNNTRLFAKLGADSGFDSIGDDAQAKNLSAFLNELDKNDQLAKTIIYNINPALNEVFASMTGNFNDGSTKGKIQYGSGWWFLDQLDGMEKQINALSSVGIISTFIGMLTDSRSFLSFPRHEYFRRLLCNIFGNEMEKGLLPNDEKWIGRIVQDICYFNAKKYFNL